MANKQNDDYHTEEEDERYDGVESKYNDEKENASNYNDEENQIRTPRKQLEVNKDTMDAMDLDGDGKIWSESLHRKFTDSKVQLQYSKSQSYNPLTYKYLHSVFISYFEQTSNNPNEEADKLLEFIKTKRTTTDKELIKRSSY